MRALTLRADFAPRDGYPLDERERREHRIQNGNMVWRHPQITLDEIAEPVPKPDEVIVQVAAVGICGSDMHMYEADAATGYMLYPGFVKTPNVLGHEFAGRVVSVGSAVRDLREGDLVSVEEIQWCGECIACRRGLVNHCENHEELGFTIPGAMAEYIACRARYCWKLDDVADRYGEDIALQLGAMVEPSGVSYQGLFNRNPSWLPGNHVLIFGAGPIGLTAQALAQAAGAGRLIMVDPSPSRRKIAAEMGATDLLTGSEKLDEAVLEITKGRGVDTVVEAAGVAELTIQKLEQCLAVNSTLVDIGLGERNPVMPIVTYKYRGVNYVGSLGHAGMGVFQNVIRLLANGRIDLRPIVSASLPLTEAKAAFQRLESREDAKILLLPNE
ncbi:MAG: scyllo-inosose 3-dehydrogenase [Chloroflexi bacterium]|nr:scyllo-inosose 3-dehydrogenase [Chloroflexota bacterium]